MTLAVDTNKPSSKVDRVFFELGYQERLDILSLLKDEKATLSTISKQLALPQPEIHRNLARLQKISLIHKDSEGTFSLTPFGRAVIIQIPTFQFLTNYSEYFRTHDFGELTEKFIQSSGSLLQCKLVEGVVNVFEVIRSIIETARKYFYTVTSQAPAELTEFLFSKIEENSLKVKMILPENALVPRRIASLKEKYHFNKQMAMQNVERKMVRKQALAVAINENQCMVAFPASNQEVDFVTAFHGVDDKSHEWCAEYFNHIWEKSELFDENKVQQRL
jgi:predicted transcriptional regulator